MLGLYVGVLYTSVQLTSQGGGRLAVLARRIVAS